MQKEINVAYGTVKEAVKARTSGDYYSAFIADECGAFGEYVAVSATNDDEAIAECMAAAIDYCCTWCGTYERAQVISISHHRGNVCERLYEKAYRR